MGFLEYFQPGDLQLLFRAWGADDFHFREACGTVAISVPTDDGAHTVIYLAFITMGCRLNLASLISEFGRRKHTTQLVDLPELVQDRFLERGFHDLHTGRAG